LAIQARGIIKKHCAECHDGQSGTRSGLILLEHPQLVDTKRTLPAFVAPKSAAGSQIIQFMEDGSMPPGDRAKLTPADIAIVKAWIEEGAGEFPRRFDEAYTHARILTDLKAAPEADRKFYRYFSLHHLLEESAGLDVGKLRDDFRKALSLTASKDVESLKAIDPTATLFRIDLRDIGWSAPKFRILDREGKNLPSAFGTFDLLLLEYPFAEMPTRDSEELVELWLRPLEQVRPIVYLRADWFVKAVEIPGLKADLVALVGAVNGPKARGFNAPDKRGPDARGGPLPSIQLRPLTKSIPIIPIDARYVGDYDPKPPAPKIEIAVTNKAGKSADTFKPGDRLKIEVRSSETVFISLIQIGADGAIFSHELGPNARAQANVPFDVSFDGKNEGLLLGDELGKQRFIIFAATEKFAPGDLIQSDNENHLIERYVHRFYELPRKLGDPLRFDPARMVRKTASIEVAR